jgi:hypothetical protein
LIRSFHGGICGAGNGVVKLCAGIAELGLGRGELPPQFTKLVG